MHCKFNLRYLFRSLQTVTPVNYMKGASTVSARGSIVLNSLSPQNPLSQPRQSSAQPIVCIRHYSLDMVHVEGVFKGFHIPARFLTGLLTRIGFWQGNRTLTVDSLHEVQGGGSVSCRSSNGLSGARCHNSWCNYIYGPGYSNLYLV